MAEGRHWGGPQQRGNDDRLHAVVDEPQLDRGLSNGDPPIEPSKDGIADVWSTAYADGIADLFLHLLVRQNTLHPDLAHC
jgi:hypothetical protein